MKTIKGIFEKFIGIWSNGDGYCTVIQVNIDGMEIEAAFHGLICSSGEGRPIACCVEDEKPKRGDFLISDIEDAETQKSYVTQT